MNNPSSAICVAKHRSKGLKKLTYIVTLQLSSPELPGGREVVSHPVHLLEDPVRVVHLLLQDLVLEEGLVVETGS